MTRDEVMHLANATSGQDWMDEAHIQRFADALIKAEREACAKVCDLLYEDEDFPIVIDSETARSIAAAIRARGEK